MKIVCDSCAAKYSIADEKVAGRVFKIRCKKCGAAIVVRGDQGAAEAAPAAAAAGFDYGGEAVWHAVVDGDQQGPFAPSQLGSMISAGTIGWDAYVWREGFEDWKPAQDIEELVQAIMNPGGAPAAAAEDPFTDAPTMASPSPAEARGPAPKAAKSGRDAGADLFAQSEASPFGGGGGDDDDVVASAASPRVSSGQAMTGARNENSVLFSLSNLQALATGSPGGGGGGGNSSRAAQPAPKAGMAMGEGSGLIDIRALANATGLTGGGGGSAPSMGQSPARIDDLLSIGSPSVGLGSALSAPVIIPEKKESSGGGGSTMILAAAIVAVALLGGAGIFAYVTVNQADPAATAPATVAAIAPGATAAPPVVAVAPVAPVAPVAAVEVAPTTPAAPVAPAPSSGSSPRRPHGASSSSSATASASAPSAPASTGSPPSSSARSSSDRDIDSLLEGALGAPTPRRGSTGSATPAPSGGGSDDSALAATPSRTDVTGAMSHIQAAVTACGGGEHGVATVQIAVAGPTGRVSNATVGGQFAGTPVGSCIARAVRGATFPHFRNPTFSFTYPFRL